MTGAESAFGVGSSGGTGAVGAVIVEIRFTRLHQLFNALDPSPLPQRELDAEADAYIVDSVDEYPLPTPLKLVIHLPADQLDLPESRGLEAAVRNHYVWRLVDARRKMRALFRQGRISLFIGLAFLFLCGAARAFTLTLVPTTASEIMAEGLLILGWVAMWRPLETFLYDWWPIRHRCRLFEKLSAVPVESRPASGPA